MPPGGSKFWVRVARIDTLNSLLDRMRLTHELGEVMHILIASIENQRYAFDLTLVERTLLALELTPLPNAPAYILGAINVHGRVLPVINLRQLLHLPEKTLDVNDHFIICSEEPCPVALWVDHVIQVMAVEDSELIPIEEIGSTLPYVQSVLQKDEQMTLLINLTQILQPELTGSH